MRLEKDWIFLVLLFINLIYGTDKGIQLKTKLVDEEMNQNLDEIKNNLLTKTAENMKGIGEIVKTQKDTEKKEFGISREVFDLYTEIYAELIGESHKYERINYAKNGELHLHKCMNCFRTKKYVIKDLRQKPEPENVKVTDKLKDQWCPVCMFHKWKQADLKRVTFKGLVQLSELANQYGKDYDVLWYLASSITNLILSIFMVAQRNQSTWEYAPGGEGEMHERIIHLTEMLLRLSIGGYSMNLIVLAVAEYLNGFEPKEYFKLPGAKAAVQGLFSIFFGMTYWYYRDTPDATVLFVSYNVLKQIAIWLNGNFFFAPDSEMFYRVYSFYPQFYLKNLDPKYIGNILSYNEGMNPVALFHMFFTVVWGGNLALGIQLFTDWAMGYDIGMTGVAAPSFCIGNLAIWLAVSVCEMIKAFKKGASFPLASFTMLSITGFIWYFETLNTLSLTEKSATCLTSLSVGVVSLVFRHYFKDGVEEWIKWFLREPNDKTLFPNATNDILPTREEMKKIYDQGGKSAEELGGLRFVDEN